MRAAIFLLLLAAGGLIADARTSLADKRVALVIGNSDYQHVARLATPANDAAAVGALLERVGFAVQLRNDVTNIGLRRALREFSQRAHEADVAVIFYAGHGIDVGGSNFLIPIDARLAADRDVEDEAISLERLIDTVEPARKLRLIILDAGRQNPFVSTIGRTMPSRPIGQGLAGINVPSADTLIAFSARHGTAVSESEGSHSAYTTALLQHIAVPGLDLRLAFSRIRDDVLKATSRRQQPTVYGSLGGAAVALVPIAASEGAPAQPPADEAAKARERSARFRVLCDSIDMQFCLDYYERQRQACRLDCDIGWRDDPGLRDVCLSNCR